MTTPLRVLIAGSGGGIGAACADVLSEAGHAVFGADRPGHDITVPGGAEQAVADAAARARRARRHRPRGRDERAAPRRRPGGEATDEGWSEVMRVNLESVFRLMRAGLPALRESGGGSFVTIGSVLGHSADRDFLTAAYAASKAALAGLVRSAALEAAPWGVRVNNVAAGLVDDADVRPGGRERAHPAPARASSSRSAAACSTAERDRRRGRLAALPRRGGHDRRDAAGRRRLEPAMSVAVRYAPGDVTAFRSSGAATCSWPAAAPPGRPPPPRRPAKAPGRCSWRPRASSAAPAPRCSTRSTASTRPGATRASSAASAGSCASASSAAVRRSSGRTPTAPAPG